MRRKSKAFNPAQLNPVIWYDLQDTNYLNPDFTQNSNNSTLSLNGFSNKSNLGTYDAFQTTNLNKLRLGSEMFNFHFSAFGNGNGFCNTNYYPASGALSFLFSGVMSPTLGTARSPFGCNDSAGSTKKFYVQVETDGKLSIHMGSTTWTSSTAIITGGMKIHLIVTRTTNTFNAWLNGVQIVSNQPYVWSAGTSTVDMKIHARTTSGATLTAYWGSLGNTGVMGEFMIAHREWTSDEVSAVYNYLSQKWSNRLKLWVIPVMPQSNTAGVALDQADYTNAALEKLDHRILQINRVSGAYPNGTYDGDVIPCFEPLKHWSMTNRAVGPCFAMAKAILANVSDPDVRILMVPGSFYSTGFSSSPNWQIGNSLATDLVNRSNLAMSKPAASTTLYGIMCQGFEQDVGSYDQPTFSSLFDGLIAHLRANITGASDSRLTVGQMVPNKNGGAITASLEDAPNRLARCAYVSSVGLSDRGDALHFDTPSYRTLGQRHASAMMAL